MDWITLENRVRSIASYRWYRPATTKTVSGVRLDCVVEVEKDYWVIVEITKSNTLPKLRTDLAKFASVRPALFAKNIFCKCYFVMHDEPSDNLVITGEEQNVKVLSFRQFSKELVDHEVYQYARESRPFGSSVNPFTGESDAIEYVPVEYSTGDSSSRHSISKLSQSLKSGRRFVLLGEYGTGKSRCLRQVFQAMSEHAQDICVFPFAIDLRRHWGAKSGEEIIRRHLGELGLTDYTDSILRAYVQGGIVFLLDGFDEIGSQSWSDKSAHLRLIRREAVKAIRDLIESSKGGILITGRHHFFDSNEEMLDCLGLSVNNTTILYAPSEFSSAQMNTYLKQSGISVDIPSWLPKRPLICQVIASVEPNDQKEILTKDDSEVVFWGRFISVLCERESRIHHALHADGIYSILKRLARATRNKPANVGPLSLTEVNQIFSELAGTLPVDESTAMLQRLPGLGRLSAESSDRQFVDTYILDGLRGDDVVDCLRKKADFPAACKYDHPLQNLGLQLVAKEIIPTNQRNEAIFVAKKHGESNPTLGGDLIAASSMISDMVDFRGLLIGGGDISILDLTGNNLLNITISGFVIRELHLPDQQPDSLAIENCVIEKVFGVSARQQRLPDWLASCTAETIHHLDTLGRIKNAELCPSQQILVTILKKTFFQPGAGRKEEALLRGLGEVAKPAVTRKILNRLGSEGILTSSPGSSGKIYRPIRSKTERVGRILSELNKSTDLIWEYASSLT